MTQGINFGQHVLQQPSRPPQPKQKETLKTYLDDVKRLKSEPIPKGITIFEPSLSDEKKEALSTAYRQNLTSFENTMEDINKTSQKLDYYTKEYRITTDQGLQKVYARSIRFHIRNGNQQITLATHSRSMMKLLRNGSQSILSSTPPLYVKQANELIKLAQNNELIKLAQKIETNPQNTQAPKRPARHTRSLRPQSQPRPIQPTNQDARPNIIFRAMHKVAKRISALFRRS